MSSPEGKFKVPSLRVVSLTAPYFHDGRFATLEQTVRFMWEYVVETFTLNTDSCFAVFS